MKEHIPDFYVDFTNQQIQLKLFHEGASNEVPDALPISSRVHAVAVAYKIPVIERAMDQQVMLQLTKNNGVGALYVWEAQALQGLPLHTQSSLKGAINRARYH